MKIINNTTEKLADDLRVTIKKRSRVSMAAACFSVYAFEELKAQLENKSTEKTYMFSVESASINGVQCDPMFASALSSLLPPFWTRSQRKPSGNFIFLG